MGGRPLNRVEREPYPRQLGAGSLAQLTHRLNARVAITRRSGYDARVPHRHVKVPKACQAETPWQTNAEKRGKSSNRDLLASLSGPEVPCQTDTYPPRPPELDPDTTWSAFIPRYSPNAEQRHLGQAQGLA